MHIYFSVIYIFFADLRMYIRLNVIVLGACVIACVYAFYFLSSLGYRFLW